MYQIDLKRNEMNVTRTDLALEDDPDIKIEMKKELNGLKKKSTNCTMNVKNCTKQRGMEEF